MRGIAIIVAAGKGQRAGVDKVWVKTAGGTVLERATVPFFRAPTVDEVIVVVAKEREAQAKELFSSCEKPCSVVVGGATRTESVRKALSVAKESAGGRDAVVAVHDGARPYVTADLITSCMTTAAAKGSAIPVVPCVDSMRMVDAEGGNAPLSRENVVRVQTPQCFRLSELVEAYFSSEEASDDATLYEKTGRRLTLVDGDVANEKITYLSDIYKHSASRVGVGFDVHPLASGRALVLGGVHIPHDKGLVGHSDADVLVHAIMDALLTAAGLPDIGHFFPPDDPKYEGADSMRLLDEVIRRISEKGYFALNISAEIMAEKPKLAPYLPAMERKIAEAVGVPEGEVTFAATTTENLGIVGEEKGMAAYAVALLGER